MKKAFREHPEGLGPDEGTWLQGVAAPPAGRTRPGRAKVSPCFRSALVPRFTSLTVLTFVAEEKLGTV
jgi:hypothetical protein